MYAKGSGFAVAVCGAKWLSSFSKARHHQMIARYHRCFQLMNRCIIINGITMYLCAVQANKDICSCSQARF